MTTKKNIGIIGTRKRDSTVGFKLVLEAFDRVYDEGDWIVSGGCPKGGDRFAETIAKDRGIPIIIFYPDWETHGRAAAFIRNDSIACHSDILIACVARNRKGGTEDTLKKHMKYYPKARRIIV